MKTNFNNPEQIRVSAKVTLRKELVTHPMLADKFNALKDQIPEQPSVFIATLDKERASVSFKNPFDIPRHRLIQQVVRMRNNFLQPDWISLDQDAAHSLPISQMGNYQDYLKKQTPQLREIESAPVRQHMFGNPFKIDKRMMVDEADIDLVGSPGTNRNNKRPNQNQDTGRLPCKRKPGPLPKNFSIKRPSLDLTPPSSPAYVSPQPSPIPWFNLDKDVQPLVVDDPPVIVNGSESPASMDRSRSPSPTLELPAPAYSTNNNNDMNYLHRNSTINNSYATASINDGPTTVTTNSLNDVYVSPVINNDKDKEISMILRESNSNSTGNCILPNSNSTNSNNIAKSPIPVEPVIKEEKV